MQVNESHRKSATSDRRIDAAHPYHHAVTTTNQFALASSASGTNGSLNSSEHDIWNDSADSEHHQHERLLRLHSSGLVTELQRWSQELEARESQLNTRDALLDQRIRQFRTWEKSQKQELEESRRELSRLEHDARNRLRLVAAAEYF